MTEKNNTKNTLSQSVQTQYKNRYRRECGVEACSTDLLVEISCVLWVSTDYLLMGKEANREITINELYSVILQLKNIAGRM